MCQPGRPRPHGLSQPGSSGGEGFHSTEVAGVALVGCHLDPRASQQLIRSAARQAPVRGIAPDREQHMALGFVGMARDDQRLDQLNHFGHVRGGPRLLIRREVAERLHVSVEFRRGIGCDCADRLPCLQCPRGDLVLDVGDVAHIGHAREQRPEQPPHHVEHDDRTRVAEMRAVVDGRAAHVHPHMAWVERNEPLPPTRQAVVEVKFGHRAVRYARSSLTSRRYPGYFAQGTNANASQLRRCRGLYRTMNVAANTSESTNRTRARPLARFLAVIGPGIVVMLADTDVGSVITAGQSGVQWGYRLLLLQLVLIPVLFMVQELTVRLGIFTGRGHGELIRETFGRFWAGVSAAGLGAIRFTLVVVSAQPGARTDCPRSVS